MRGTILTYNGATGIISGEDGKRYPFSSMDLQPGATYLPIGSVVDFEIDDRNNAKAIYVVSLSTNLNEKNKWTAAILCFLLGIFGVHKFYLGKTNAGIIMLVCGTVGWLFVLPGLAVCFISFIELIIYLVKSEQSFYEDYVAGNKSWF
jgi:TM2 domain-containing membrane protein YozV